MNANNANHRGCRSRQQAAGGRTLHCAARGLRPAFTLIELLIVIAIISAVTVATVPMLVPALDIRRIRESARLVNTVFSQAQSEAVAKGRSVGVWIDKLRVGDPTALKVEGQAAKDLFLCEVPQPYAGDASDSTMTVKIDR